MPPLFCLESVFAFHGFFPLSPHWYVVLAVCASRYVCNMNYSISWTIGYCTAHILKHIYFVFIVIIIIIIIFCSVTALTSLNFASVYGHPWELQNGACANGPLEVTGGIQIFLCVISEKGIIDLQRTI